MEKINMDDINNIRDVILKYYDSYDKLSTESRILYDVIAKKYLTS